MPTNITAMIHVPDVENTADWYSSVGFDIVRTFSDGEEMTWALIGMGDGYVMFNSGGISSAAERREVDLYINTTFIDQLYEKLKDRVDIVQTPYDAFHGNREFIIRDINRFWITFAQANN